MHAHKVVITSPKWAHISTLSACRTQFIKQQPEDYICRRAVARKFLVFIIHSSWWFHVFQRSSHRRTPCASPKHVWVLSLGRMIDWDLANLFHTCLIPNLSCGSLHVSWRWAQALVAKYIFLFSILNNFSDSVVANRKPNSYNWKGWYLPFVYNRIVHTWREKRVGPQKPLSSNEAPNESVTEFFACARIRLL